MMTPTTTELSAARQLVYQGVGRNVLQFQRVELLLKYLLGWHEGAYTSESVVDDMQRGLEAQKLKTLGTLAGELFSKLILQPASDDEVRGAREVDGKISHRLILTTAEETHEAWQAQLRALVEERNRLVHGSLLDWDLDTVEGCQDAIATLDEQRGRIAVELEKVKHYHEALLQSLEQVHQYLTENVEQIRQDLINKLEQAAPL